TELSTMASHLAATLEATADGILLTNNAGSILNMNRRFSQLWQVPGHLLVERDDAGILAFITSQLTLADSADSTDRAGSPAICLMNSSTDPTFEILHLKDERVFEWRSQPASDRDVMIGRVYSCRDVTDRHHTQQELITAHDQARLSSRAKGEFLAVMSHEIRTPMAGVLGLTELLQNTPLNAEQTDYVRMISASGKTLLAVINDILDFSKIEAGKLALELIAFSPVQLLEDVAQLFRVHQPEGEPELRCEIDGKLPPQLLGDPTRVRQILFNLLGNAFKFTEKGSVTVQVSCSPESVVQGQMRLRFSVQDTGIGIPEDRQASVFNAFEQADSATTRRFGGTGLGLSICSRLTRLMGGEIGLNSSPGEGSEFWFTVAVELPEQVMISTTQAGEIHLSLPSHLRVLVVEDHPVNRVLMLAFLKSLGVTQVVMAVNGLEGVSAATRESFDLVLMDAQMPVMDGYEATSILRGKGLKLPIVGVSAGALEEERQTALSAGMNDYVHKPISKLALCSAIQRVLAGV
ncbi:MAG: ATP-binding protein, partial [Rhodoferax sp.]|nr:ATP-binding protein [Rhodoferax sp.]